MSATMMDLMRITYCVISLIALFPNTIASSTPFFSRSINHNSIVKNNKNSWGIVQRVERGGSIATDEEEVKKPKKKKKSKKVTEESTASSSTDAPKKKKKVVKKEAATNYDLSTAILTKSSHTIKHTLQVIKKVTLFFTFYLYIHVFYLQSYFSFCQGGSIK